MLTIVYLLLGLAFMGGLFYALMQITARQKRLNAELTRLERLAAEVSLNAEAILDRVDERSHQLLELLERAEAAVAAVPAAPVVATPVAAPQPPVASEQEAPKRKRTRKPKETPETVPDAAPAPAAAVVSEPAATAAPASIQKYQQLRDAVRTLADQGKDASEIAQALGIPRGEVLLLLNLRAKKVTA